MASLNVKCALAYQDAPRGTAPASKSSVAHKAIKEYKPRSVGVVRRMARSDHWRWVSTPRWARHSAKVTSTCQRRTKQVRISTGSSSGSVLKKACGSCSPLGSRTRTQRSGTGGEPARYQTATSEAMATVRVRLPYQPVSVTVRQTVAASASRFFSLGRRRPFTGRRPRFRGRHGGTGANRLASRRRRLMTQHRSRTAASNSSTAKLLSPTNTTRCSGSQRHHAQDSLAGPVGERLVAPAALGMIALRRRQDAEERQGPDPLRPGDRGKHHEAEPAQAAGLDEMLLAGAHRVAVDAARRDPGAPAALDGIVEADHHRPVAEQGRDNDLEQTPGRRPAAPACAVEHLMVAGEVGDRIQAHDAQGRGDGALA